MFLIFGIINGTNDLGAHKCRLFACCGCSEVMALVTCTYQQFSLFFIPLFRFGKQYFVSCPNCGTVYEIRNDEGKRMEKDFSAEISPDMLTIVHGATKKTCPSCKCAVDTKCRYCPNCGTSLL